MTDNIVPKHGCLFRCLYPQNMGVRVYQTCCHGATLITLQWKDANKSKFKKKRQRKGKIKMTIMIILLKKYPTESIF